MLVIAAALLASNLLLIYLLHRSHRQEVQTIHGLLELADKDHQHTLTRVDNLIAAQHAALAQPHPDLDSLIRLVDRLCQRLQAPDHAIVEHQLNQPLPPSPPAVTIDDDQAFWEAQNLPKEQLAEDLMAEELNGT